jgi:hypothetical protein
MVVSAGETDLDLAVTQFPQNCIEYNSIEFKHYIFKNIQCFIMFTMIYSLNYNFIIL